MFDKNSNNQSGVSFSGSNLPTSGNPAVQPKAGRDLPGTEDIFAETDQTQPAAKPEMPKPPIAEPVVMPELGRFGQLPPLAKLSSPRPIVSDLSAKVGPPEPLAELPDDLEEKEIGSRKFFGIGLAVLVVILGVGGYFVYSKFFASSSLNLPTVNLNGLTPAELNQKYQGEVINLNLNSNSNVNQNENANDNANTSTTTDEFFCPQLMPTAPDFCTDGEIVSGGVDEHGCQLPPECNKATTDTDGDGLTDAEEATLGTNPNIIDSDNDGLSDREEVKVYQTDPLNPDTDGDGYLDGNEVTNDYNPKGTGKLLDLNF